MPDFRADHDLRVVGDQAVFSQGPRTHFHGTHVDIHGLGKIRAVDPLREAARQKLARFLAAGEIRPLFDRRAGRSVRTEQEFLSRSGALYRVDRLVIDPDSVTVLDYKTGGDADEQAYREQIQNYMTILRDVFPGRRVSGAIAYIDALRLVPVPPAGEGHVP